VYDIIENFFCKISSVTKALLLDTTGGIERCLSGKVLINRIDCTANFLKDLGVNQNDRVVCVSDNSLETAILVLTAMRHGICICMQPAGTSKIELERVKELIGARAIINTTQHKIDNTFSMYNNNCLSRTPLLPETVNPQTPFTITFTSGTTGKPKAIVHCAESFLNCADNFNKKAKISSDDKFLNIMPMFYMAGIFNGLIAPLSIQASVIISDAFNTSSAMRFWSMVEEKNISALWLSPTMLDLIIKLDRSNKKVSPSLKKVFVGTGAMAIETALSFEDIYNISPIQSYGLSELLYVSVDDGQEPNFGSVGYPLDGIKIISDGKNPLCIDTPYSFLGYLVNGEIHPHSGPFQTSDLGLISDKNILSILGRCDDIIVRGGVNINPIELENVVNGFLDGMNICIVGKADSVLGEKVVLVSEKIYVDKEKFSIIRDALKQKFGRSQIDDKAMVDHFPVSSTGKIQRKELKFLIESDIS